MDPQGRRNGTTPWGEALSPQCVLSVRCCLWELNVPRAVRNKFCCCLKKKKKKKKKTYLRSYYSQCGLAEMCNKRFLFSTSIFNLKLKRELPEKIQVFAKKFHEKNNGKKADTFSKVIYKSPVLYREQWRCLSSTSEQLQP